MRIVVERKSLLSKWSANARKTAKKHRFGNTIIEHIKLYRNILKGEK